MESTCKCVLLFAYLFLILIFIFYFIIIFIVVVVRLIFLSRASCVKGSSYYLFHWCYAYSLSVCVLMDLMNSDVVMISE